jgi:hypothetical protein
MIYSQITVPFFVNIIFFAKGLLLLWLKIAFIRISETVKFSAILENFCLSNYELIFFFVVVADVKLLSNSYMSRRFDNGALWNIEGKYNFFP